MYKFFKDCAIQDEEKLPKERADKIKALVLSRIEEEKPMKKHFGIKPLVIVAAVMATMALSVVTVNAATNGMFLSKIFRTNVTKTLTTKYGDIYIELEAYADGEPDEGKPAGVSIKEKISKEFSGKVVHGFGYSVGSVQTDDDAGYINVNEMSDGGVIGYKLVYRTGEIILLTDEEVQRAIEEHEAKMAETQTAETE